MPRIRRLTDSWLIRRTVPRADIASACAFTSTEVQMRLRTSNHFVKQKEISDMLTPSEWTRAFQWMRRALSLLMLALCVLPSSGQSPATQANVVTSFSPPYTIPLSEIYTSQQLSVIVTAVNGP